LDGTDLGFRRLGSLTEARSLKTRRTGVPWNPNVSRRRFSRYRRYEKCTDDASDAKNTNVGGEIAACVA
jgi:hypothetical protein